MPNYPGPYNTGPSRFKPRPIWPSLDEIFDLPFTPESDWPGGVPPDERPGYQPPSGIDLIGGPGGIISPGYPGGPPRGGPYRPRFGPSNPFFEGFETDPEGQRANFMGRLGPLSTGAFNFANSLLFPSALNRYKQQGASQILGGAQQVGTFSDFLDRFNFNRALRREMPGTSRFSVSPARFNY